jgi:hypothetical protein
MPGGFTASALLIAGSLAAIQAGAAAVSVVLGPESAVYQQYIRWAPAANLARGGVVVVYTALLLIISVAGGAGAILRRLALPTLVGGGLAGLVIGALEGPIVAARHFPRVIALDLVELLLVGSVLVVGLARSIDRLLWIFLGIYTVRLALNILWMAARVWLETPDVWVPSARGRVMLSAGFWAAMFKIALYRYLLARRGVQPEALLPDPVAPRAL